MPDKNGRSRLINYLQSLVHDKLGVAVYLVKKTKDGFLINDVFSSPGFVVYDKKGDIITPETLRATVPEPDQIAPIFSCANRVLRDGRERSVAYTSTAPGYPQPRISVIRKIDSKNLAFIIRKDRRTPPPQECVNKYG